MRALTHSLRIPYRNKICEGRNEVLAREGIDTHASRKPSSKFALCRNEVLAREGIDTE